MHLLTHPMKNSTFLPLYLFSLIFIGGGCFNFATETAIEGQLESNTAGSADVDVDEVPISVVGTWALTFWDERYPDTPISTTGTFFADGTAKTNYPAHYTVSGNQITVTADNDTTISVGTIEDSDTIIGTWEYPEKETKGTWKGERIEEIE